MSEGKRWNYLEVNRGRYLCFEHGSFCDSSDGYLKACPLCPEDRTAIWAENPVDRALQVINNLQNRSKRNAALASVISGGLAGLGLIAKLFPENEGQELFSQGFFVFAVGSLLVAIACYAFSMRHVPIVDQQGRYRNETIEGFSSFFSKETRSFECWHSSAGLFVGLAVILFIISVSVPPIKDVYYEYQFRKMSDGAKI